MRSTLSERWARWWLEEFPPLDGRLRLVVYGGLFVVALTMWKSPLRAVALYARTDPILYRAHGLIDALGLPWLPPEVLYALTAVTGVAWICAAIGLFGRTSAIVTAVGAFTIHGYCWGTNAFNHNWYLPVYVLGALCFAAPDPTWSVDAVLRRRRGLPGPPPSAGLGHTGFAPALALVFIVAFYFCAGITKLQEAGLVWIDGHTIAYWSEEDAPKRIVARWLGERMWLCAAGAWLTLLLEVGAPLALVSRRLRPIFVLGWIGMHVGILLSMGPRYFENMIVFLLVFDWAAVRAHGVRGFFMRSRAGAPASGRPRRPSERWAVAFGSACLAGALAVAAFQISWWPLSHVYMYSAYYSRAHEIRAGERLPTYENPAEVQRIAQRFRDETVSFDAKEHLPTLAELRLVREGVPPLALRAGVGTATAKQWNLVVELPVLVEDLTAKPPGRIAHDPRYPDAPANRFLREVLPVIRRDVERWVYYDRAELVIDLDGNEVAIGSVPLAAAERATP